MSSRVIPLDQRDAKPLSWQETQSFVVSITSMFPVAQRRAWNDTFAAGDVREALFDIIDDKKEQ